jgi:hypothetical protein
MADTAEHVRAATTVAAGTVDWTATDGQTRTYSVDVDSVYKGAAADSEKLVTNAHEAACGLADLATDRRYLFFIEGQHPGAMRVGLCGGTVGYDDSVAARIEAVTGPPGKPLPSPDLGGEPSGSGRTGPIVALGLTAGLLAVAVGVVVRRRG